jgi:hypothetical protein
MLASPNKKRKKSLGWPGKCEEKNRQKKNEIDA